MSESGRPRKSHHGCTHCKRRKIKCDEVRPACSNCVKRKKACEYNSLPIVAAHWKPPSKTDSVALRVPEIASPPSITLPESSQSFQCPNGSPCSSGSPGSSHLVSSPPEISLISLGSITTPGMNGLYDMELFHHYVRRCSYALTSKATEVKIMRDTASDIAIQHPFLLHGLFALSALHLADTNSSTSIKNHYISLATRHYASALSLYQQDLSHITPDNCSGVFLFSCIAALISIAFTRVRPTDPVNDLLNIITLLKGVRTILGTSLKWILNGPFGDLLNLNMWLIDDSTMHADEKSAFQFLFRKIQEAAPYDKYVDEGRYYDAVLSMERTFRQCVAEPNSRGLVMAWMVTIDNKFLKPLKERTEIATAILVVYGVALHKLNNLWWAQGTGKRLVLAMEHHLGVEWAQLTNWAKEKVGAAKDQEVNIP